MGIYIQLRQCQCQSGPTLNECWRTNFLIVEVEAAGKSQNHPMKTFRLVCWRKVDYPQLAYLTCGGLGWCGLVHPWPNRLTSWKMIFITEIDNSNNATIHVFGLHKHPFSI